MNGPQLVHAARGAVPRDRLIRLGEVETIAGIRKSTIYSLMKAGEFPRCVQVTPRCVAWAESQIHSWVQARIAGAAANQEGASTADPQTGQAQQQAPGNSAAGLGPK